MTTSTPRRTAKAFALALVAAALVFQATPAQAGRPQPPAPAIESVFVFSSVPGAYPLHCDVTWGWNLTSSASEVDHYEYAVDTAPLKNKWKNVQTTTRQDVVTLWPNQLTMNLAVRAVYTSGQVSPAFKGSLETSC